MSADLIVNTAPHPRCLSATGVVGDVVYRVRQSGAWELFKRGRPGAEAIEGGVEGSFSAAWAAARKRAGEIERDVRRMD